MSKKITHEQARESIEMVDGSFFPTEKEALLTYIKQQEKQEKLLKQIKDIINRPNDVYIVSMLEESEKYAEIVKLIKELENDK